MFPSHIFRTLGVATISIFLLAACGAVPTPQPTAVPAQSIVPSTQSPASIPTPTPTTMSNPIATLETSMGTIKIELFQDKVPNTVDKFVKLTNDKFYDGVLFHRVIPNFMAQTGDPNSKDDDPYNDGRGGPGYKFADEFVQGLTNERGTLAMANSGPNTNGSQFFINVVSNDHLNNLHTVFGKVIEGLEIVDKIVTVPTITNNPQLKSRPVKDIKITSITIN